MASTGKGGQAKKGAAIPSLKEQGHQQVMDLLGLADKSPNPDIRAAAIEIAKGTAKYEQKQRARLAPALASGLLITLGLGAFSACWYAFLHQQKIAYQLTGISILVFIVLTAIILSLTGTLSQANLMQVLGWAFSYIKDKTKFGRDHKTSVPQLQAGAEDNVPPEK
jgi:hypothetical protein